MATRILGPTGSPRRRWSLIGSLFILAAVALALAGSGAASVNDVGVFQLQGAPTQTAGQPGDDWNNICTTSTQNPTPNGCTGGGPQASHRVASAFDYDLCGDLSFAQNCTIFTGGGSKDDGDISGWGTRIRRHFRRRSIVRRRRFQSPMRATSRQPPVTTTTSSSTTRSCS